MASHQTLMDETSDETFLTLKQLFQEWDIESDNWLLICLIEDDFSSEQSGISYSTVYFYFFIPLGNLQRLQIWME